MCFWIIEDINAKSWIIKGINIKGFGLIKDISSIQIIMALLI